MYKNYLYILKLFIKFFFVCFLKDIIVLIFNLNFFFFKFFINFILDSLKAPLSKKVVDFLKKEKEIEMEAIYQFNLKELELLDVGSNEAPEDVEE